MSYQTYVQNLKKEIEAYIKLGGDIYVSKKELPFYEKLNTAAKQANKEGLTGSSQDKKYHHIDVYRDCDIPFSRRYMLHKKFIEGLSSIADENGFVDCIKSTKTTNEQIVLRSYLSDKARTIGVVPSDYLILMTSFRYKDVVVKGNYIDRLQKELNSISQDGEIKNIRHDYPSLYEKLKVFRQYGPIENLSLDEALEFFGIKNTSSHFPKQSDPEEIAKKLIQKENALVDWLKENFSDRQISHLRKDKEYKDIIKIAATKDQSPKQWFESHGFDYKNGLEMDRLSRIYLSPEEALQHEQEVLYIKNLVTSKYFFEQCLTTEDYQQKSPEERFEIDFAIAKGVGQVMNSPEYIDDNKISFDSIDFLNNSRANDCEDTPEQ